MTIFTLEFFPGNLNVIDHLSKNKKPPTNNTKKPIQLILHSLAYLINKHQQPTYNLKSFITSKIYPHVNVVILDSKSSAYGKISKV